jgi:hypothetical protein
LPSIRVNLGGQASELTDTAISFAMKNIKGSAFERMQGINEATDQAIAQRMLAEVAEFGPRIEISQLTTGDSSGRVEGNASLSLPPNLQVGQFAQIAQLAQGEARLHVDAALVNHPLLGMPIGMLAMMQVLVEESDGLGLTAKLEQGIATLNGQQMPVPALPQQ